MNIFELFGQMSLKGVDKANRELEGTQKVAEQVQKGLKIMGAAFTAVGAMGLKFASESRNINSVLGSTAITLGVTTKELRDLTLATTNVTFPIKSVAATFDILTRAGVRNTEELQKSANAFDALADATGSSAEVVADILIPALKAMGEDLPQTSAELDKFTWLTKNTTTDLTEFGSVMNYVAMYGDNLNVSLDDMIAIMAVLESKGKGGATATRLFRTAVTQAADGSVTLNEALGITTEEIAKYRNEIDGATGLTDEHAEAMNKQFGIMEKVKQKFSELTLVAGSFLEPLEPILAGMTALGPLMIFLSTQVGLNTVKWVANTAAMVANNIAHAIMHPLLTAKIVLLKAVTAAQWLWNAAMSANPIGLVIVAIGGLIAAGIALWKNWDKVKDFFEGFWINLKVIFAEGVKFIVNTVLMPFIEFYGKMFGFITQGIGKLVGVFNKELGASIEGVGQKLINARKEISEWADNLIDTTKLKKNLDEARNVSTKYYEEQLSAAEKSLEERAELAEKERAEAKSNYDKQRTDAQSSYDKQIEDLRKQYGILEGYGEEYTDTLMDLAREDTDNKRKSLDKQMDDARKAHSETLRMLDEEYKAKLKTIDAETAWELDSVQRQIDAINDQQEAENRARDIAEDKEKEANLRVKLSLAESDEDKKKSQKELDDFLETLRTKNLKQERQDKIESLRGEMDTIRKQADEERNQLEQKLADKKESEEKALEVKLTKLKAEQNALDGALEKELIRIEEERFAKEQASQSMLDKRLTDISTEENAFNAQLDRELEELASFVENYNTKLDELKNKTVTVTTVHEDIYRSSSGGNYGGGNIEGFDSGALIMEPTWLTKVGQAIPYGVMAEKRPEYITREPVIEKRPDFYSELISQFSNLKSPVIIKEINQVTSSTPSINVTGNNFYVRQETDIDKIAEAIVSKARLKGALRSV